MVMPMSSEIEEDEIDFLDDEQPPKTGEDTLFYLLLLVGAGALAVLPAVVRRKRCIA
jgi:LPXTG-motif cell wall-anchored protein